jgi:peptidoglycan/xylan/chitin deacetylase (PgdA/CDA1 family)
MQPKSIPILMYHSIKSMPKGTKMRGLHVPPKRFSLQMWLLKLFGYRCLSMSKLQPYLTGMKSGKVVGLTFDDGYKNNLTNALPILKKYGFSATCYIVSQNIGGINHWDINKGIPENPMMNKEEIQSWISSGMEIGSHTQNHVLLSKINIDKAKNEIINSKADLEEEFNTNINHFCYPYGDYNDNIVSETKNAGYQTATTVNRGRACMGENLFTLHRVSITHHTLPHLFLLKVLGNYEDKYR